MICCRDLFGVTGFSRCAQYSLTLPLIFGFVSSIFAQRQRFAICRIVCTLYISVRLGLFFHHSLHIVTCTHFQLQLAPQYNRTSLSYFFMCASYSLSLVWLTVCVIVVVFFLVNQRKRIEVTRANYKINQRTSTELSHFIMHANKSVAICLCCYGLSLLCGMFYFTQIVSCHLFVAFYSSMFMCIVNIKSISGLNVANFTRDTDVTSDLIIAF